LPPAVTVTAVLAESRAIKTWTTAATLILVAAVVSVSHSNKAVAVATQADNEPSKG